MCSKFREIDPVLTECHERMRPSCNFLFTFQCVCPQGCSSPIVVKFADTQKDKEQRRLQQQLAQQMQQLNTATWGNLTGLGGLTPQYLAVSAGQGHSPCGPHPEEEHTLQSTKPCWPLSMLKNSFSIHFESQELLKPPCMQNIFPSQIGQHKHDQVSPCLTQAGQSPLG